MVGAMRSFRAFSNIVLIVYTFLVIAPVIAFLINLDRTRRGANVSRSPVHYRG